jgi:hypothetical protein
MHILNKLWSKTRKIIKHPATVLWLLALLWWWTKKIVDHAEWYKPNITVIGNDNLRHATDSYVHLDHGNNDSPSEISIYHGKDKDPQWFTTIKYFKDENNGITVQFKITDKSSNRIYANEKIMRDAFSSFAKKYKKDHNITKFAEESMTQCIQQYIIEESKKKSSLRLYLLAGGIVSIAIWWLSILLKKKSSHTPVTSTPSSSTTPHQDSAEQEEDPDQEELDELTDQETLTIDEMKRIITLTNDLWHDYIEFDELTTITKELVETLTTCDFELHFSAMTTLDAETADALAQYSKNNGRVYFRKLDDTSEDIWSEALKKYHMPDTNDISEIEFIITNQEEVQWTTTSEEEPTSPDYTWLLKSHLDLFTEVLEKQNEEQIIASMVYLREYFQNNKHNIVANDPQQFDGLRQKLIDKSYGTSHITEDSIPTLTTADTEKLIQFTMFVQAILRDEQSIKQSYDEINLNILNGKEPWDTSKIKTIDHTTFDDEIPNKLKTIVHLLQSKQSQWCGDIVVLGYKIGDLRKPWDTTNDNNEVVTSDKRPNKTQLQEIKDKYPELRKFRTENPKAKQSEWDEKIKEYLTLESITALAVAKMRDDLGISYTTYEHDISIEELHSIIREALYRLTIWVIQSPSIKYKKEKIKENIEEKIKEYISQKKNNETVWNAHESQLTWDETIKNIIDQLEISNETILQKIGSGLGERYRKELAWEIQCKTDATENAQRLANERKKIRQKTKEEIYTCYLYQTGSLSADDLIFNPPYRYLRDAFHDDESKKETADRESKLWKEQIEYIQNKIANWDNQ